MRIVLLSLGLALAAAPAVQASTSEAWKDLQVQSDKACVAKATDLRRARVIAYSPYFETHTVSTVEGLIKSGARKGKPGHVACLFDKRTGKAEVDELEARR